MYPSLKNPAACSLMVLLSRVQSVLQAHLALGDPSRHLTLSLRSLYRRAGEAGLEQPEKVGALRR